MDPTIEPTANLERPIEATRGVQLLVASLAIGLIRAIFGLTQRATGAPLIVAILIVSAVFGLGFILILRLSATNGMKTIKSVLLLLTAALAVGALMALISSNYRAALACAVISVLAYLAFKQRNWARLVVLVLVLFGLPFAIKTGLTELKQSVASGSLSIIIAILQLLGTYLLFTKNSNLWFRKRK